MTGEASFKRLRFEYHPDDDESLVGAFVSACHGHPLIRVATALEGGGLSLQSGAAIQTASRETQEILARIMRTSPGRLSSIAYANEETGGKVALGDFRASRSVFEWRVRRIGPVSFLERPIHRSAWLNRLLPYCPASLERLVDECPTCGPLGWTRTRGIDKCEQCGVRVPPSDAPSLSQARAEDYRAFAGLMARDAQDSAHAIHALPDSLDGFSRTTIASVALRAPLAVRGLRARGSIEKIVAGQPEAIIDHVCAAMRVLRGWPHSIQAMVTDSMQTIGGDVSGYDDVRAAVRWIARDAGLEGRAMIDTAFPDLDGRKVDTFAMSAKRYYTATEVNTLLWTSSNELERLREAEALSFEELPSGRRFRARYDADEIDDIRDLLRNGISYEAVAERLKVPVYAISQAAEIGLMGTVEHPALAILKGRLCSLRSMSDLESSVRVGAGQCLTAGTSLRAMLKRYPGEKPWGFAIAAMKSGELAYGLRNDRVTSVDIILDIHRSRFKADALAITRIDPMLSELVSLRDACEILGTAFDEGVAALQSAGIEAVRTRKGKGIERHRLLKLCCEIAFTGEAAAWSGINPQRLYLKLVKLGLPKSHGGWLRRHLADLGYVSDYVVE